MRLIRTFAVILGLLVQWAPCAFAQTAGPQMYYVSPNGHDADSGMSDAPVRTLQAAAHIARPGDTVIARPGQYEGFVLGWDERQSGRPGAPIKYIAQSGAVIISRNSKTSDGIDLEPGCDDIVIQGFTVNNTSNSIDRAGIRVSGSNRVSVIDNTVAGCGNWGIFTSHSSDLLILNNTTTGSKNQHGIYVSNSADHPIIRGNIVFGNYGSGIHLNGDLSQGGNGLITNALIENNIIHDNGAGGGSGINCDGVQNSIIRCNLLYANRSAGISLFHTDGATGSTGNLVVNNTIVMARRSRYAININSQSTGNVIFNNILLNPNPLSGSITVTPDSRAGLLSDFNIVEDHFRPDGEEICDLPDWQSITGQDRHSRRSTASMIFMNFGGHDFRLSTSSAAIHFGTPALRGHNAPAVDLEGDAFGPKWDIGAYRSAAINR